MPSARSSESDSSSPLQKELALLVKARAHSNFSGDDLLQAFQDVDRRSRGYISSKSDFIDVLCDAIATKYQRRVDFDLIFKAFRSKKNRFEYVAFCEAFEKHCKSLEMPTQRQQSPKKSQRSDSSATRSPLKSPQKRSNWLINQQQQLGSANAVETPRDIDGPSQSMRLDPRLETQRLLVQSIRRKVLAGVVGGQYDGFKGIEELLFMLDEAGEGYIDDDVFETKLLRRLKKPLTKQESDFLLASLRVRTESGSRSRPVVHYEHLASFCNLDSDASADDTDEDASTNPALPPSPKKSSHVTSGDPSQSLGGAEFLAAEQRLRTFFQQPVATQPNGGQTASETPRSIVTGAELFLERAEIIDKQRSGFLTEQDFHQIFHSLHLEISLGLVRAVLERFPRSSDHKVDYHAFLERYGENPERARERRKLKRTLATLVASIRPRDVDGWLEHLTGRFETYDARLHKHPRGDIPEKEFVRALCRSKSSPVVLPVADATSIAAQFLRVSRSSRADAFVYREFLALVRDCRAQEVASIASPKASTDPKATSNPSNATPPADHANVADYLIHDATEDERAHFELLMDTLHKFQQRVAGRSSGSHDPHRAPDNAIDSAEKGRQQERTPVGEITPIDNGIVVALGAKLQVRIQFAVSSSLADANLVTGTVL